MAYRVAENLTLKKRYAEAGQVLLDYAQDVREAIIALVQGNHFSEARRIISLHELPGLLEDIVDPAALEARAQISEDLTEMREQLQKQVARLRELRIKKVEQPEEFYETEDLAMHNVDVMTDASAFTSFTRYTVAPSTSAPSRATTKRTSRSKRKMERKVGSGRKGTVDEEEYLLKSLTKLASKLSGVQDEAAAIVPHLLRLLTPVHRTAARELQMEVAALSREIAEAFDEVWPAAPTEDTETVVEPTADSWAARMVEREKERERAVKAIVKPDLRAPETWRTRLVDVTATPETVGMS